jgi:restriction system protein
MRFKRETAQCTPQRAEAKMFEDNGLGLNPAFIGRKRELEWLSYQSNRSRFDQHAIVITGPAGIGKTSLVTMFLAEPKANRRPWVKPFLPVVWSLNSTPNEAMVEITARIEELYEKGHENRPSWVVIDNAEILTDDEMNVVTSRLLNMKAIERVLFATRRRPKISRAETLELGPLNSADIDEILRQISSSDISQEIRTAIANAAGGVPRKLKLLAEIIGRDPTNAVSLLKGHFYEFGQGLILPKKELIAQIRPQLISVNETLVKRLQREPRSVFELPPRKFEELVAELLSGLGYQVELTPATRDGGKDILAYMSTPHGRLLCLVEAKRYRHDRVIGIELVRQLYGTLIDADASSAMLVTTSSFSSGAKAFQQKHQYKLTLRDYGHIVEWIQNHRPN